MQLEEIKKREELLRRTRVEGAIRKIEINRAPPPK
jgi:hypothetical protein